MHGHTTFYCPKVNPAEFAVICETVHSRELGTYQVLRIGPLTIHADRRQLHQINKALSDCLAEDKTPRPDDAALVAEATERR